MFHRFHPSEISLASQRLKKFKAGLHAKVITHAESGFELELITEEGHFSDLRLFLTEDLASDDFLFAFFIAERELMRGRELLELTRLSFREWESFFRDFNHQQTISETQMSRCEGLHEELMNAFVEDIFNHAWRRACEGMGPMPGDQWIKALNWISEVLKKFFASLSASHGGFELLSWHSLGDFPHEMSLTIGYSQHSKCSQVVLEKMKIFLLEVLEETKEIKLVAE